MILYYEIDLEHITNIQLIRKMLKNAICEGKGSISENYNHLTHS